MKYIFFNEWKGLFRSKLLVGLSLFFLFSLSLVSWLGIYQNKKQISIQNDAHRHIRAQWDEMGPTNPHGAAHFGTYAFKPSTPLTSMDEGINAVTGNVLRLEGHTQNDLVYSEASQSLTISKFGKLKPSLLFQFVIPLFLIFLSFNTYTKERESGRLKLLMMQGISARKLLFAKMWSVWTIGILLLFISVLVQIVFNLNYLNQDTLWRVILFFFSYAAYYLVISALTIGLSVLFKSSTAALSTTIALWVLWTIFLPKIAGNAVEQLSPLPTRVDFQKAMEEDRSKGIDGHNPFGDRQEELERATLEKYQVDSISQLPINFDGLLMQADEEYGNSVWDKHFGQLYDQMKFQKYHYQLSGLLNPFASLQNLSMGTAGTDMIHHLDFLKQAEGYRRQFIKTLNDKHAYGGSKTGDWSWKADNSFFRSVADFQYKSADLTQVWSNYLIDILALFLWVSVALVLVYFSSKRISDL